jgi:membrane protease YdiL (CAAX protease family)
MTALAATGWTFGSIFLFHLILSIVRGMRPAAELDEVTGVACQAIAYLVTLFFILRVHAPDAGIRDFIGMRPTSALFYPLAIALGLALEAPADTLYGVILKRWPIPDHMSADFLAASSPRRAAMALAAILVGPVLEEMLFRGALLRPMLKVHPASMVITVTAALFALAHILPQMWLPIMILGLVLGFVRRASGSLVPSMLVHVTFNAVPFYMVAAQRPGAPESPPPAVWMVGASAAAAVILLACVHLVGMREQARVAQAFDLR